MTHVRILCFSLVSIIKGDEDDDSQTIFGPVAFEFDPPQANYELKEVPPKGVQGNKQATIKFPVSPLADGVLKL